MKRLLTVIALSALAFAHAPASAQQKKAEAAKEEVKKAEAKKEESKKKVKKGGC